MKTPKKTVTINISPEEIKGIFKDYSFEIENMDYDDKMVSIINAFNTLSDADKIILSLYAEFSSQRKVAKLLNVSRTSIVKCLTRIREQIFRNLC